MQQGNGAAGRIGGRKKKEEDKKKAAKWGPRWRRHRKVAKGTCSPCHGIKKKKNGGGGGGAGEEKQLGKRKTTRV